MNPNALSKQQQVKKLLRFYSFYGLRRTLNKAFGRLRNPYIKAMGFPKKPMVSILGTGQFAFSCIAYFVKKNKGLVFLDCYDIEKKNAESLAHYYRFKEVATTPNQLLTNEQLDILYIASNHASHTPYAIQAMEAGIKKIYLEKPISVNPDQFISLIKAQNKFGAELYAGYNRPYSKAIRFLKEFVQKQNDNKSKDLGFSINFFISGHLIPKDHWYRKPEEGTRICGNMGHWLDLSIHIFAWRKMPSTLKIQIAYTNPAEPDDNITITMTSDLNDLVAITLTSRSEPFEGINETVNFQYGDTIAKVNDFRNMTIWHSDQLIKKNFFPKDVGHERAVLQPFEKDNRNWDEVILSTLLMLHITKMVRGGIRESDFNINNELDKLNKNINQEIKLITND